MVAPKPQVRSMFATPVCIHFLPVAQEFNAELRPIILAKSLVNGADKTSEGGWRSPPDFESWGGGHAQTLFRVLRELADSLTATRTGGRVTLAWQIAATAAVRQKSERFEGAVQPGAFWSGVYYVDDGYQKSDDEALGGDYELADPRGALAATVAPQLGFRVPNGLTVGQTESIRPQSGMIILHPSWQPRGEKRYEGPAQRITIEFDLAVPPA